MSDLASATLISPDNDPAMENFMKFWKLYRFGHPEGSVQDFYEWFAHLCELQKTVPLCPWCGELPSLRVYGEEGNSNEFNVLCDNEKCEVQPWQRNFYKTPEEAIAKWQMKPHK